jgi:hypothetical protein
VEREKQTHTIAATFDILQGDPREVALTISGEGEIKSVTGEHLQDWSVRQETNGVRTLVLRARKTEKPITQLNAQIFAERPTRIGTIPQGGFSFTPPNAALFNGFLKITSAAEISVVATNVAGLIPVEAKFLPENLRKDLKPEEVEPTAFRFHGTAYVCRDRDGAREESEGWDDEFAGGECGTCRVRKERGLEAAVSE